MPVPWGALCGGACGDATQMAAVHRTAPWAAAGWTGTLRRAGEQCVHAAVERTPNDRVLAKRS